MKKSVVVLVLAIAVMGTACSVNTCPTYAHAPVHKTTPKATF